MLAAHATFTKPPEVRRDHPHIQSWLVAGAHGSSGLVFFCCLALQCNDGNQWPDDFTMLHSCCRSRAAARCGMPQPWKSDLAQRQVCTQFDGASTSVSRTIPLRHTDTHASPENYFCAALLMAELGRYWPPFSRKLCKTSLFKFGLP